MQKPLIASSRNRAGRAQVVRVVRPCTAKRGTLASSTGRQARKGIASGGFRAQSGPGAIYVSLV